ncbi:MULTISPECIES: hypothetical protein [Bacillus]|jgi:hypothetical protein|uniref:Uncharacterized protein n=2 Tax=Bacillus cereus group TaxID=86661 RepID=R8CVW6_BACCE|nr:MULTISPECIES: hypothetical protein [Bacillus]EEL69808.1 hypothetical protein bcere0026_31780 [Bacillus mycoides]EOO15741.1 hypothetical protein IGA_03962 [Bacillus cereus HuA3-9]MBK5433886.1 hypothetical protein [Bacillus sp. TH25]
MANQLNAFQNCSKEVSMLLSIPKYVKLVHEHEELRDGVNVEIQRYQAEEPLNYGGSHITTITSQKSKHLLSYTNMMPVYANKLPHKDEAEKIAMDVMEKVDRKYAKGLTLLRIEKQTRHYVDGGQTVEFPVLWIKMMHNNGSFNWMTIGGDGQIIEFEREVRWDYMMSRRQTEMWYYDDWVLARMGEGPQLLPPSALA